MAREVTAPGEPAHDAVLARFGGAVTARRRHAGPGRARRGSCSPTRRALRELEAIVHPAVRPRILAAIDAADAAGAPAVVIEAIKLVEGGLAGAVRRGVAGDCDAAAQRERLLARGTPAADADRRIAAQAGLEERVAPVATRVVDTSGDAAGTRAAVEALFRAAGTA